MNIVRLEKFITFNSVLRNWNRDKFKLKKIKFKLLPSLFQPSATRCPAAKIKFLLEHDVHELPRVNLTGYKAVS